MARRNGTGATSKRLRKTWWGYPRENGDVGARNYLLLLSGTLYANPTCERVARTLRHSVALTHPLGRCQIGPDIQRTFETLVGHGQNANAGAVIVIDHHREEGCTADEIAHEIAKTGKRVEAINIREDGGAIDATAKATRIGMEMLRELTNERRQEVSLSKLLLGLNCGTSDTTSGLSHNKATGWVTDQVVKLGGRALLAETTEMMGGEDVLAAKCVRPALGKRIWRMVEEMEERILACGVDLRGSQPTGDNMEGGLTTIEEKSLGAIQKAGSAPIVDVIPWAKRANRRSGLHVMDTPGHGGESITGIAAGGSQVLIFSTGGGHTINHPLMSTIRITGNPLSARLQADTTDVDVTDIFEGAPIEVAGRRVYDEVLDVASGKMTKAEILHEDNAFAINRIGPSV
ncbi:MAG: UxaA family hydrolase [Nitrospinae bacterium]|nr:UxaA family hydrolase [Nitrospinota bacterium]